MYELQPKHFYCLSLCSFSFQTWSGISPERYQFWAATLDGFALFAVPVGFLIRKIGLRRTGFTAALLDLLGYSILYLVGEELLPSSLLWLAAAMMGQGSICSVILTLQYVGQAVQKQDRGRTTGVLMTAFGLSGGIFTGAFNFFFKGAMTPMVLLSFGILMFVIKLPCSAALPSRVEKNCILISAQEIQLPRVLSFCIILVTLVCLMPLASAQEAAAVAAGIAVPYLCVIALLTLIIVLPCLDTLSHPTEDDPLQGYTDYLEEEVQPLRGMKKGFSDDIRGPFTESEIPSNVVLERGYEDEDPSSEVKYAEALKETRFWALWFQFAVLVGGGFAFLNHMHDIVLSDSSNKGAYDTYSSSLVISATALFTVGNVCSRFLTGYAADILSQVLSRTTMMNGALLTQLASFLLLLWVNTDSEQFYWPALVNGLAFGAPWTLVPSIEACWYSMADFARIHGVMMLSCVFGVFMVNDGLSHVVQYFYRIKTMNQHAFNLLWTILAALCAVSLLIGLRWTGRAPRSFTKIR